MPECAARAQCLTRRIAAEAHIYCGAGALKGATRRQNVCWPFFCTVCTPVHTSHAHSTPVGARAQRLTVEHVA